MLSFLNSNIIKSILQININKYSIWYSSKNYVSNGRVIKFPDFNKLLNIINITKLYSIMINIKRHKYITDETILIIIQNIQIHSFVGDDDDYIFEYKKCIKYFYSYPYCEYELLNNRIYDTNNVLLFIHNGKYLNLANCHF